MRCEPCRRRRRAARLGHAGSPARPKEYRPPARLPLHNPQYSSRTAVRHPSAQPVHSGQKRNRNTEPNRAITHTCRDANVRARVLLCMQGRPASANPDAARASSASDDIMCVCGPLAPCRPRANSSVSSGKKKVGKSLPHQKINRNKKNST